MRARVFLMFFTKGNFTTRKYTELRIINYSFLVYNDDESNENESVESNLIQLQGWQAIVKENKECNLKYDINNDQIIS